MIQIQLKRQFPFIEIWQLLGKPVKSTLKYKYPKIDIAEIRKGSIIQLQKLCLAVDEDLRYHRADMNKDSSQFAAFDSAIKALDSKYGNIEVDYTKYEVKVPVAVKNEHQLVEKLTFASVGGYIIYWI